MDDLSLLANLPTEAVDSRSAHLDRLSTLDFVTLMNTFDQETVTAVFQARTQIAQAIDGIADRMQKGGRLFYIGAGTSGRLGVLDASECPPTFSVPPDLVVGIIAGGDTALRNAAEGAEDDPTAAGITLSSYNFNKKDALVAISASGYAPYCMGGLDFAKSVGALAISLACNKNAPMSPHADIAIEAPTGAEILSGSTRLKAGTATKMILNMLTTGVMVKMGKTYGNLMVDLKPTNNKLKDRAVRIVMQATHTSREEAQQGLADAEGNVKQAILTMKGEHA